MLLAGKPFCIQPSEIDQFTADDMNLWVELALKRLKLEAHKRG